MLTFSKLQKIYFLKQKYRLTHTHTKIATDTTQALFLSASVVCVFHFACILLGESPVLATSSLYLVTNNVLDVHQ